MALSPKTVSALKAILVALGPGGYDVEHSSRIIREGRKRLYGRTHYQPKKRIMLYKDDEHCFFNQVDTILHELLHAAYPEYSEEMVEQLTLSIAKDLWSAND